MGLSRKKLLIIGAVLVVGALMFGVIPLNLLQLTVNTDGEGYYHNGFEGNSQANGGNDLIISGVAIVTSWTGGGASEPLLIQGKVRAPDGGKWFNGVLSSEFDNYWYIVSVDGNNPNIKINGASGTEWTSTHYDAPGVSVTSGDWIPLNAVTVTITNPDSGSVLVQMWAHHHWLGGWLGLQDQQKDDMFASDYAYLRSGVGSVKVQNDVVEENTNVNMFVETAYAHSARADEMPTTQGWILNVYNPSGSSVFQKTLQDNFAGTISWLVPTGSYSASSTNIYKVILRNELIDQDDSWFFTVGVGMIKDIPSLPTFVVSPDPPYHPGDQVTVTITAKKTTNPIAGFWVWVSYETSAGTTTQYVYEKKWYPATTTADGSGTATVTWTFPDSGYARMEASAADTMNLNSGMSSLKFTVNSNSGGGGASYPFDWTQLVYVIVALIGAVVVWFKVPLPNMYKIIIVLVLIAVAFYFAWPLMTTNYSSGATWIPGGLR